MKRFVVIVLFLGLCVVIGIPSNTIHNAHEGEIDLPINSLAKSFGLEVCNQEIINKQCKKKNYRRIKKGIKTFTKKYQQYKNDDEKQDFEKIYNQCLLPVSIPASDLKDISITNLNVVDLGDEQLYCLNGEPGSFIEPSDFYAYTSNIQAYLKAIKGNKKVKSLKRQLIKSKRGSRAYKILQKKLRAAILERNNQKLLKSYSELFQELCSQELNENTSRFNESEQESGEVPFITPEPFPSQSPSGYFIEELNEPTELTDEEIEALTDESPVIPPNPEGSEGGGAIALSGFTIDTQSRQDVLRSYLRYYLASEDYENVMLWTGNVSTCNEGTVSSAFLDKTHRRVNYYRAQAGLPSDIIFNNTKSRKSQEAALVSARQNDLSHAPAIEFPNNPCLTSIADEAAGFGNQALGSYGPRAVDRYMVDSGGPNIAAGHRRWILFTRAREMGDGSIPNNFNQVPVPPIVHNGANTLWVIGNFKPSSTPPQAVAWPNEGYVPYQILPNDPRNPRWSYSYPGANFVTANVVMRPVINGVPGASISVVREPIANGYGDNTIVWKPSGISHLAPEEDTKYRITISGVVGIPQNVCPGAICEYDVTIIDPYKLEDEVVVSGPSSPTTGTNNLYTFNSIEFAEAYRVRTARVENFPWTEGAETSPTPRIIDNTSSSYSLLIGNSVHPHGPSLEPVGSRAFHLTIPDYEEDDQNFVINRVLFPSSSSRLEFINRFRYVSLATELSADISIDDGASWNTIWNRFGDSNSSAGSPFRWETSWQAVSIDIPSEYEGKTASIRFNLKHNNSAFTGTSDELGAFIDQITLTSSNEYIVENIQVFPGETTNFNFTPTQAGATYALQVQPAIEDHFFEYGPEKFVISTEPPPNRRPVADAGLPQTITLPIDTVRLDGSGSSDPDQATQTLVYEWRTGLQVVTGLNPIITLDTPGEHIITLTVTDNQGEQDTDTVTITVNPEPFGIIGSSPDGEISFDTSVNLFVQTNRNANCRFHDVDTSFDNMPNDFSFTGTISHAELLTVVGGQTYNYFVRCQEVGDPTSETASATLISFTVESDSIITFVSPLDVELPATTETFLTVFTDTEAICHYDETDLPFDDMSGTLNNIAFLTHRESITVEPGESYDYFVRCRSIADPTIESQEARHLFFSIAEIPLEITQQPIELTIIDGMLAIFSVETNYPENQLQYEWYKNDVHLPGYRNSKIEIDGATEEHNQGEYHVKVKRLVSGQVVETIESEPAALHFIDYVKNQGPLGFISPNVQTVQVGQPVIITVQTVLDPNDLIFFWYRNGKLLLGEIYTNTLIIPAVDLSDNDTFYQVLIFRKEGAHLGMTPSNLSAINVIP